MTDSFDTNGCGPLDDGLGFLSGSACPHYDGEALRRGTYLELVGSGFPAGYAAEDGVGLHFVDGELANVVGSRPGAGAYAVRREDTGVSEERLAAKYLGKSVTPGV
ncbi:hypothetical protein ACXJJ3_20170 [Kribbella sp. WER1]